FDPLVHHLADGDGGHHRALLPLGGEHHRPGGGGSPLGGGGPLTAVLQRGAVLPLGGTEVGGGHSGGVVAPTPGEEQGGQRQALPHGGAGPIEAQIGIPRPPGGKGGADALVEKVSRQ